VVALLTAYCLQQLVMFTICVCVQANLAADKQLYLFASTLLFTELSLAESSDPTLLLRRYERQIKELKQELSMRDALRWVGRASVLGWGCEKHRVGLWKQHL
jgi:hypothetical protein